MSSHYAQNKSCQLFQSEFEAVLHLAQRLASPSGTALSPTTSASPEVMARSLLTETHVRGLVTDALVRVSIPGKKREALILGNPFIQAAVTSAIAAAAAAAAKQQQQQQQRNQAGHSGVEDGEAAGDGGGVEASKASGIVGRDRFMPTHRVGKVVALLAKPGAEAASVAPADWLLAVHLGDCTELFPLKAVSEDVFTETEHQVYVQTVLGSRQGAQPATLMTGEQAEALKRRLVELRHALLLVLGAETGHAGGGGVTVAASAAALSDSLRDADVMEQRRTLMEAFAAAAARSAQKMSSGDEHPRKRARQEADDNEDGPAPSTEATEDVADTTPSSSHDVHIARLTDTVARQSTQLQALRQLVQRKEADIAAILQQQQQKEQQHADEVGQLRSKTEEEARAHQRRLLEAAEQRKEAEGKLQAAGEALRNVAAMAAKYKKVYNVLVTSTLGFSPEEAKTKDPEEVIALLKARKTL